MDGTTMMYGCALRIFQLRSLTIHNFTFTDENKKGCVTVPAKSINDTKITEIKEIHPEFVERIKEIVNRRYKNNNSSNLVRTISDTEALQTRSKKEDWIW